MKIKIIFGQRLDGAIRSRKKTSLGSGALGPNGMLTFLEGRLGIENVVQIKQPERINQYRLKYERYLAEQKTLGRDSADIWAAQSFETDDWSTAEKLLAWRDELIEGFWSPGKGTGGGARLATLDAIESIPLPLSPGRADRLRAMLIALKKREFPANLALEITLQEPMELLPAIWRKIFEQLRKVGVTIIESNESVNISPSELSHPDVFAISGNDRFELTKHLVRYLAAKPDENDGVTLLCPTDTRILDGMLHRYGLGAIGNTKASSARPSLAILPLFLEMVWEPFQADRFLELVLLPKPNSPVPGEVLGSLIKVIKDKPGIGGEEWNKAWEDAEQKIAEKEENSAEKKETRLNRVNHLKEFLNKRFLPEEGVPADELILRLDWLKDTIQSYMGEHPELASPLSHIKTLKTIVETRDVITRIELIRILDSIIGSGTPLDNIQREVTLFDVVTDPGMITDETKTLLWSDCVQSANKYGTIWTPEEQAFFASTGVEIDSTLQRRLDTFLRFAAIRKVKDRVVLFIPDTIDGEEVFSHPLLYDLASAKGKEAKKLVTIAARLETDGVWKLADRELPLVDLEPKEFFSDAIRSESDPRLRTFNLAETVIKPEKAFSHSQLTKLLGCPFAWLIESYLQLKDDTPNLPTGKWLYGNLSHKISERLLQDSANRNTKEVAKQKAESLFEELVPVMAAETNSPESKMTRERIKTKITDAIGILVDQFHQWNIESVETEVECNRKQGIAGHDLEGKIDLIVTDSAGRKRIIDNKWSNSGKYSDPKDRTYLQLAIYIKLLGLEFSEDQAAFFLIPKKELVWGTAAELQKVWDDAEAILTTRLEELQNGIVACESEELTKGKKKELFAPNCDYCKFAILCGKPKKGDLS